MKKIHKKSLLIITAMLSVLSFIFCAYFVGDKTAYAAETVDVNTITVDVVGNLEWGAVDGADGYNWTYTVGGQTSDTYYAEDNKVNVGVALTKAAQKAKKDSASEASIKFTITPKIGDQNGTSTEYTYTFTQYIDYGYATHDITDINAKYRDGQTLEETFYSTSAMYKNDVLTMGVTFNEEVNSKAEIYINLFGEGQSSKNLNKYVGIFNHKIEMKNWGTIVFKYYNGTTMIEGGSVVHSKDKFGNASDTYNKSFVADRKEYLSMAVFDTYDLTGNAVGETIWFDRSINQDGKLVSVGGGSHFYDRTTIANLTYEETDSNTYTDDKGELQSTLGGMHNVKYDRSAIRFTWTTQNTSKFTVSSGILDSTPSLPYYDNVDASFNWNRVEEASEYQWAHGDNAWQTVKTESVSVSSLLEEYKDLGYLPLKVRAVVGDKAGATTYFNIDLKEFYQERSVAVDISETGSRFTEAESYYSSESVEDKNAEVKKGYHVSLAFKTNSDATIGTEAYLFKLGLFGAEGNVYHNQFNLIVNNDGEIQLSRCGSAASATQRYPALYWRNVFVEDGFKAGEKYFVTFGVDDVYTGETKTAERITLRFYKEEGMYRKTIANISYDYRQFDDESVTAMEYDDHIVYQMAQDSSKNFLVGFMPASFDVEYDVYFVSNNEVASIKTVKYGQKYDFYSELATDIKGYNINGYKVVTTDLEKDFEASGFWNVHSANGKIMVETDLTAIEYDVTYEYSVGAQFSGVINSVDNKSKYDITSDWTLQSPENIPDGYVFDGWYAKSDEDYSDKITTLKGHTGNITLVARYKRGGYMTVITEELSLTESIKWTEDSLFTLEEKFVFGKKFVRWQVLKDGSYVDYQGTKTFTPTQSYTFKAIYDFVEYNITYVADGATHANSATKYTVDQKLILEKAEKDGYFFLGWYKDADFTLPITDTDGLAEELTLYARFMKNTLPNTISVIKSSDLQALPVPELPEGATYTAKLYKGEDKLDVIENTYFVFDQNGEYMLKYTITLPTGEKINKQLTVTAENGYIVTVNYSDGTVLSIVKRQGETIDLSKLNNAPDGFVFKGIYTDSNYENVFDEKTVISEDMNLYVKYDKTGDKKDSKNIVLAVIISAVSGIAVTLAVTVSVALIKKRKRKGE